MFFVSSFLRASGKPLRSRMLGAPLGESILFVRVAQKLDRIEEMLAEALRLIERLPRSFGP